MYRPDQNKKINENTSENQQGNIANNKNIKNTASGSDNRYQQGGGAQGLHQQGTQGSHYQGREPKGSQGREQQDVRKDPSYPGGQKVPGSVNFENQAGSAQKKDTNYQNNDYSGSKDYAGSKNVGGNQNVASGGRSESYGSSSNTGSTKGTGSQGSGSKASASQTFCSDLGQIQNAVRRNETPLYCDFDFKNENGKEASRVLESAGYKRENYAQAEGMHSKWVRK